MAPRDLASWSSLLPVGETLPALRAALAGAGIGVLQAPTGAGKTTLVPLALLDAPWLERGRIVMLEPRRLATRAAARRMAEMLGQSVGGTVGYRTRLDTRIGPETRIEVVTEGILLRLIQDDPALDGIGLVIFDEFHERNLDGDLGLALALESRQHLRQDLRLLVMSATLDGEPVARLLGGAPIITSAGRSFPVALRYLDRPPPERLEAAVAAAIRRALDDEAGSLLVFLPGGAEIRRVERLLSQAGLGSDIIIAPLYGDLPQAAQDEAIRPAPPGRRKLVLATPIAETSLTIEGIRVVIDSGARRAPRFDPASGMTRLDTVRVSQASSEQRRGRAGRLAPGVCYRLWREAEQAQLIPFTLPEILEADLAPLALELARWGASDPAALAWLDPPPPAAFAQASELLRELGALDAAGRITAHGRAMAGIGLHPRLAHMALIARARGEGRLAIEIAALLGERDIVKAAPGRRDADLTLRLELLRDGAASRQLASELSLDRGAAERVRQAARQLQRQLRLRDDETATPEAAGRVLALAYPDRIAQRRAGALGPVPPVERPRRRAAAGRSARRARVPRRRRARWRAARRPHLSRRTPVARRDRRGFRRRDRDGRDDRLGQPRAGGGGEPPAAAVRAAAEGREIGRAAARPRRRRHARRHPRARPCRPAVAPRGRGAAPARAVPAPPRQRGGMARSFRCGAPRHARPLARPLSRRHHAARAARADSISTTSCARN